MMPCRNLGPAANGLLVAALLFFAAIQAAAAADTYDLLFRTGTLDGLPRETLLTYERQVSARANEQIADRETGTVRLDFAPEDMAVLTFLQGDRHRTIGSFPAKVGNPLILYFVESIVRDMATTAGGSPFYIRNRIKASLEQDNPVLEETLETDGGSIKVTTVTLQPFRNDPNKDRMKGFGDLELTVRMSEQIPGWYYQLQAEAPVSPETDGDAAQTPVYASSIRFRSKEMTE